jgi:HD-GYP domain-containing protein (c-di-GMP phosphodiesterase class II)
VFFTATLIEIINAFPVPYPYSLIIFGCVILFLLILFIFLKVRRHFNDLKIKLIIVDEIENITHQNGYEAQLSGVLELMRRHVTGDGYFLYLHDDRNDRYRLERVLFQDESGDNDSSGKVEVGYGRIMSYAKERYSPPIAYEHAQIPVEISYVREGRHSLLVIPVLEHKGFIGISTKKRQKKQKMRHISYLSLKLRDLFVSLYNQSVNLPSEISSGGNIAEPSSVSAMNEIMDGILSIMNGQAGLFFSMQYQYCELAVSFGFSLDMEEILVNSTELFSPLTQIAAEKSTVKISKNSKEYALIPDIIRSEYDSFILCRSEDGFVVVCYTRTPKPQVFMDYRIKLTQLLVKKATELYNRYTKKTHADEYLISLKEIAGDMDNEEPYSVGYSDLMARYAMIISKELGLNPSEIGDVEKAAFLCNIGMLMIPESILRKKGIYSESEYEIVKGHAQAGAFLAELFTGNKKVANYIRHHHEQMDGLGYPDGLKGDDIPKGARIISVIQHFLSKIKGRNYRDPLPFDKIVQYLTEESGESLDPQIVDTLVHWFRRKQENRNLSGKTLGSCWEMRCSSEDICLKCPAYKRTDKFCWEFDDNNCQAHGNTCETCYVYTEYKARNQ